MLLVLVVVCSAATFMLLAILLRVLAFPVSCTLLDALVVLAAMTIRNRNYGCHQAVLSRCY